MAEHALKDCNKGAHEKARLLMQQTRSLIAFEEGDLNLALNLAREIDNPAKRVCQLIEIHKALDLNKLNSASVLQDSLHVALLIKDVSEKLRSLKYVALSMRKSGLNLTPIYEATMEIDTNFNRLTQTYFPVAVDITKKDVAILFTITGHCEEAESVISRMSHHYAVQVFCEIGRMRADWGLDPKDAFVKAVASAVLDGDRDTALRDIAVIQKQLGIDPFQTFVSAIPSSTANPKPYQKKILTTIGEIIVLRLRRKMSVKSALQSALDLASNLSDQTDGEKAAADVADMLAREGCFDGAIEVVLNLCTQTLLEETMARLAGIMLESTSPPNAAGFYSLCAKIENPKSRSRLVAKAGEIFHKAGLDKGPLFQEGANIAARITDATERCEAYCELAKSMFNVEIDSLLVVNTAIESANKITYTHDRTPAINAIVEVLAITGRPDPVIDIILQSLRPNEQAKPLAAVATELSDARQFKEALAVAERIPDCDVRLQTTAEVHSRSGQFDKALRAILQIVKPEIQCSAFQRLCRSQLGAGHDISETFLLALDSARRVQPNGHISHPFREILELCPERDLDKTEIISEAIAWADAADQSNARKARRASVAIALAHRGRFEQALQIAITTQIEARKIGHLIGIIASAQLAAGDILGAFSAYDAVLAGHDRALEQIGTTLLESIDGGLENGALAEYLLRACRFVDSSIRACAVICHSFPESSENVVKALISNI